MVQFQQRAVLEMLFLNNRNVSEVKEDGRDVLSPNLLWNSSLRTPRSSSFNSAAEQNHI